MAKEELKTVEDTMRGRFLTFVVGEEVFGLEIRYVTEIIGIQPISVLPEMPEYVKGIINLRGKIIPVIDMRLKLNKGEIEYTDRTCIIVIETQEISAGLIVDRVEEVLTIDEANIVPPDDFGGKMYSQYMRGVGKVDNEVKLLLDCEELFDEDTQTLNDL